MTYVALWLVAFLLNGDPVAFTMIVPADQTCGEELATRTAKSMVPSIGAIQDIVLWRCESLQSPGPDNRTIDHPDNWPLPKKDS